MSDGGGFFSARFFREDVERGLFKGWRESAWVELSRIADYKTGIVRLTVREMSLRWDTSVGSVDRWLGELDNTGRYVRLERLGATARDGRRITVLDIEERNKRASDPEWNKEWNKNGTKNGTTVGTKKSNNGAANRSTRGTKNGTTVGTKTEQSSEHVQRIEPNEELLTVPSEPCAGGGQDLFGEPAPTPSPAPIEPDEPSTAAKRVVAVFHELSKAKGGNGVSGTIWGAQQKMAEAAIKNGLSEKEATDALRWGMGQEFQRVRLRAHGMKVLVDVWSAWVEQTGGSNGRNGTGRSGASNAGGETGASAPAGRGEAYLNNGRWERRQG